MYVVAIIIGYLFGMLSPAAFLSKVKQKSLKEHGSGNLGATNALMVFGLKYGIFVMLFDIGKAFLAVKLSLALFPKLLYAGIVAGFAAVVGHIYPFYLRFRGGKGLAAYGGMILALTPRMVPIVLITCVAIMLISNHGVAMAMSVCTMYPVVYMVYTGLFGGFILLVALSTVVLLNHRSNLQDIKQNKEVRVRDYIKEHFVNRTDL